MRCSQVERKEVGESGEFELEGERKGTVRPARNAPSSTVVPA